MPALLDAAAGDSRQLAVLAVEGLAKAGVDLTEVVERLLLAPADEILPRLLPALFRFDDPAVVRWAEQGLESTDPDLHARAAYALCRQPRPEAAPLIRPLLLDSDSRVRGWAARALATVGERGDIERLRPLLDDADAGPTIQALRASSALAAVGKASAPADWLPRLLGLLDDPRAGVRLTAIEVAAHWLGTSDQLSDRLLEFVRQGSVREQELALGALAAADDPHIELALPLAMANQSPRLRAAAARAAGLAGEADLIDDAAVDPDAGVRRAALDTWLLADIASEQRVRLALDDPDYAIRSTALEWLAEHPVVEIELLVDGYQRALRDRGADARLSATSAIAARADAEPLERGAAIEFLETLADEAEYLVRRQAIEGLRQLDREPPELGAVATGRSIAVYRDIALRTVTERYVEMATDRGTLRLRLDCPQAPLTCLSFLQLAGQGFFNGLTFHRVVPDFVIQGGDPRGDGVGGPGYTLRDEINLIRYQRGTLGMAHAGPDTAGSQFFVTLAAQPHLDGGYTAFGQVVGGDQVLDQIMAGDHIVSVREVAAPR